MRQSWILLGLGCIAASVLLFGCVTVSPPAIEPAAAPPPTPAAVAARSLLVPEGQPVQLVSARFPLPAPTTVKVERPELDNSTCIACHTSQKDLKALAVEPEETESLSEGEG